MELDSVDLDLFATASALYIPSRKEGVSPSDTKTRYWCFTIWLSTSNHSSDVSLPRLWLVIEKEPARAVIPSGHLLTRHPSILKSASCNVSVGTANVIRTHPFAVSPPSNLRPGATMTPASAIDFTTAASSSHVCASLTTCTKTNSPAFAGTNLVPHLANVSVRTLYELVSRSEFSLTSPGNFSDRSKDNAATLLNAEVCQYADRPIPMSNLLFAWETTQPLMRMMTSASPKIAKGNDSVGRTDHSDATTPEIFAHAPDDMHPGWINDVLAVMPLLNIRLWEISYKRKGRAKRRQY